MHYDLVIYSANRSRGGILKKILELNNIKALLFNKVIDVKDSVYANEPEIVILDISQSLDTEINFLINLVQNLKKSFVLVLGMSSGINRFYEIDLHNRLFVLEKFDTDHLVLKIKDLFSSLKTKDTGTSGDMLEADLKKFLKLG